MLKHRDQNRRGQLNTFDRVEREDRESQIEWQGCKQKELMETNRSESYIDR